MVSASIESATVKSLPNEAGEYSVQITLTVSGQKVLNALARKYFGADIAIVFRNAVLNVEEVESGPPSKFSPFSRTVPLVAGLSRSEAEALSSFLSHKS
jgi:preprotein translocase subunit SecD